MVSWAVYDRLIDATKPSHTSGTYNIFHLFGWVRYLSGACLGCMPVQRLDRAGFILIPGHDLRRHLLVVGIDPQLMRGSRRPDIETATAKELRHGLNRLQV